MRPPAFTTHEARVQNLRKHIKMGTLVRKEFGDGYERACLLSALAPEVVERDGSGNASRCPAHVMPTWFAQLTPNIDDFVSLDSWDRLMREYAALAAQWHVLSKQDWNWLHFSFRIICLKALREPLQPRHEEGYDTILSVFEELRDDPRPMYTRLQDANGAAIRMTGIDRAERKAIEGLRKIATATWYSVHYQINHLKRDAFDDVIETFFSLMQQRIYDAEKRPR
jgi:hypothetical protein